MSCRDDSLFTSSWGGASGSDPVVIPLPARQYLVEATYVVRVTHRVRATCVEQALEMAAEAEMEQEMQVVDMVSAKIVHRDG